MSLALATRSSIDYSIFGEKPIGQRELFPTDYTTKWMQTTLAGTMVCVPLVCSHVNLPTIYLPMLDFKPDYGLKLPFEDASPKPRISLQEILPELDLAMYNFFASHKSKLVAEFNERAERWEKETAIYSAPAATYFQKDYMFIMAKGMEAPEAIVPLILDRLSVKGGDWFFALENIAGENPAKDCEDYESAVRAWSQWAKQRGLIKESDAVLAA